MKKEIIFITWHLTSHGMAYFKHILSGFYSQKIYSRKEGWLKDSVEIEQEKLNEIFSKNQKGFTFDKVYYLTPSQEALDKVSRRRFEAATEILKYPTIKNDSKLLEIWEKVFEEFPPGKGKRNLEEESKFIMEMFGEEGHEKWKKELWRTVQFFSVEDQIKWLREYSNIGTKYSSEKLEIKIFDKIKNYKNLTEILKHFVPYLTKIKQQHKDASFIINVSLARAELQLMWYLLNENLYLPGDTHFITAYDRRFTISEREKTEFKEIYFYPVVIKKVPNSLYQFLPSNFKNAPKFPSPNILKKQFEVAFKSGLSILLIGERGTGKSQLIESLSKEMNKKLIKANCAGFTDSSLAQSELFGYVEGAFTGAKKDKKGLFEEAEGGVLFLDEIHHLDKSTQSKLLLTLQTDSENNFLLRKVGSTGIKKVKCHVIFATNIPINELKQKLLPDFYDRISHSIIELPPLRTDKKNIKTYFKQVWENMKFGMHGELTPKTYEEIEKQADFKKLIKWIKTLSLDGNFRDLEKIALFYFRYLNFDKDVVTYLKESLSIHNPFEYTKYTFEKYHETQEGETFNFKLPKDLKDTEKEFRKQIAQWAINKFGNKKNASEKLGINESTLYRWKKGE